jgi:hypothetical protein
MVIFIIYHPGLPCEGTLLLPAQESSDFMCPQIEFPKHANTLPAAEHAILGSLNRLLTRARWHFLM